MGRSMPDYLGASMALRKDRALGDRDAQVRELGARLLALFYKVEGDLRSAGGWSGLFDRMLGPEPDTSARNDLGLPMSEEYWLWLARRDLAQPVRLEAQRLLAVDRERAEFRAVNERLLRWAR